MRKVIEELSHTFETLLNSKHLFVARKTNDTIVLDLTLNQTQEDRLNTCAIVSEYLLDKIQSINIENLRREEFRIVQKIVDEHYVFVKGVTREKGVPEEKITHLRAQTLVLKLGAKIPIQWVKDERHKSFWQFIVRNYLHHDFFALRFQVPFDPVKGPSIPVYREGVGVVWIPFMELSIEEDHQKNRLIYSYQGRELFDSDFDYVLGSDFSCFYTGIQRYNIYYAEKWIPYDKRNPKEWGNKYFLEVWITSIAGAKDHPSMLYRTHAYMILLDKDGYLRSVGQDALIDIKDYKVLEVLSTKPGYGKIATPDRYVLYPTNARNFWSVAIEITKEQHDRIIKLVESDKKNPNHAMSVQKKNCVSYTLRILREILDFDIDASIGCVHIFFKNYMPDRWYRKFMNAFVPWFERRSLFTQKALHFFPPFYLAHLITLTAAWVISQNNYQGERDFNLLTALLTPWKHSVDHPLPLHRVLEKHADENGLILLKKDQPA